MSLAFDREFMTSTEIKESLSVDVDPDKVFTTKMSNGSSRSTTSLKSLVRVRASLLTGGVDRHYANSLAEALAAQNVSLDVVGSDEIDGPELHNTPGLRFLNLRGSQGPAPKTTKIVRLAKYYSRLLRYITTTDSQIFHILWHTRIIEYFDRTALLLYMRLLGKKIAFTAHNVNAARRDGNDSLLNRLTLRIQYRLVNHIFVHTEKMKSELIQEYGVKENSVTVMPYPVTDVLPDTNLSCAHAKQRCGVGADNKTMLFFGRICSYKGIEYLLEAFQQLVAKDEQYRLIIAGEVNKGAEDYLKQIDEMVVIQDGRLISHTRFIPDDEIETYFKAADVLVLPYKDIFQSGVLFLAYSFGLPVIATDVGSFRQAISEGRTGFICKPCDAADLARAIEQFFGSSLFQDLGSHRRNIREFARTQHSSVTAGILTRNSYVEMMQK